MFLDNHKRADYQVGLLLSFEALVSTGMLYHCRIVKQGKRVDGDYGCRARVVLSGWTMP
jgi:hypothetical protein